MVQPTAILVNAARNYTFSGTGSISGGAGLTKSGSGTLIIANSGANDYTGATTITAGTLQVGNGATAGIIPLTAPIANDGVLAFNRSDAIAYSGLISGAGSVNQLGPGTLTLSAGNTFSGGLNVNGGAVRLTNATAAGSGTSTVNAGGTLVVGAPLSNLITLSGGAIGSTGSPTTITSNDLTATTGVTRIPSRRTGTLAASPATSVTLAVSDGAAGVGVVDELHAVTATSNPLANKHNFVAWRIVSCASAGRESCATSITPMMASCVTHKMRRRMASV